MFYCNTKQIVQMNQVSSDEIKNQLTRENREQEEIFSVRQDS